MVRASPCWKTSIDWTRKNNLADDCYDGERFHVFPARIRYSGARIAISYLHQPRHSVVRPCPLAGLLDLRDWLCHFLFCSGDPNGIADTSMKSVNSSIAAATDSVTCDYCGLPTAGPSSSIEPSYCCFGCRFADGISAHSVTGTHVVGTSELGPASALGLSVFFTMNVVMLTMALWSYADADNAQTPFESALRNFLRYGALAFSTPVLLLLGRPLISHAIAGLRRSTFTTDLLLTSGVLAAFAVSVINTLRGDGHVYYEVACVILVLVTLGRWLEASGKSKACEALDQLERLVPETVQRWDAGRYVETAREVISVGDLIRVIAGERIPLDGRVCSGRGVVDEHFFTGESTPVEKDFDDVVLGGSLNLDGDMVIEVTSPPSGGALGRLVAAVRAARLSKGRYQLLSDAWSQWFFPIISVVAFLAFLFHGIRVNWEYGLLTALSVVLIACPCALALATPLAVWVALGTAAKHGVLFRNGCALETLAAVRAIRWDKTGTLTTGTPRVVQLICKLPDERSEIERSAAKITETSRHPFSKAIREFLSNAESTEPMSEIQTVPGRGLRSTSETDQTIVLGSARWMDECGLSWGVQLSNVLNDEVAGGNSLTAIGYNGQVRGLFLLEETIRPEAAAALQMCHKLGLDQAVLTGDRAARASVLANALGLPVESELLPENKLAAIHAAHERFGRVAMVGDGLNDAPALAGADIGIAMGCGADVSRDSADICLLSSDLRLVPWSYDFSRRTVRTIRTNLIWSFAYNGLGVIVAACGELHPAVAAALMVVSSLIVLTNSHRLSAAGPQGQSDDVDNQFRLSETSETILSTKPAEVAL